MRHDARSLFVDWTSSREVFAGPCLSFLPLKKKRGSGSVPLPITLSYMHQDTGTAQLFMSGCLKLSYIIYILGDRIICRHCKASGTLCSDCNMFYADHCSSALGGSELVRILNEPNEPIPVCTASPKKTVLEHSHIIWYN